MLEKREKYEEWTRFILEVKDEEIHEVGNLTIKLIEHLLDLYTELPLEEWNDLVLEVDGLLAVSKQQGEFIGGVSEEYFDEKMEEINARERFQEMINNHKNKEALNFV